MSHLTRRQALRFGGAAALGVAVAGCGGEDEKPEAADSPIPGVEGGKIVDSHALASAHADQLAEQRATLYESRTTLDTDTGTARASTYSTTEVDGEQINAVVVGSDARRSPESIQRKFYFDGGDGFVRSQKDGEWQTRAIEPGQGGLTRGDLTGKTTVEIVDVTKTGMEPLGDRELHRFANTGQKVVDGQYRRFRIQALISDAGLVRDFQQTVDATERGTRETNEWFVDDLGTTVVEEPEWVAGVDA